MCTLIPITKSNCPTGRAGIARLWTIPSNAVTALTFDADGNITGITLDCLLAGVGGWTLIEFQKDTAFFNQTKQRVGDNIFIEQSISFNESIMNATVRKALLALNKCCSQHAVVQDNTGRYHYAGITVFDSGEWQSEELKTGDGSGNTGADSTADANEYIETLGATAGSYAPFVESEPVSISTDCSGSFVFGPVAGGTVAYGPVAAGSGSADAFGPSASS